MESPEKNEKIFLDTSGLVALFLNTDSSHQLAKESWVRLQKRECRLYTSEYVFDELVTLLTAKSSHHFACEAGQSILESRIIKVLYLEEDDVRAAFEKFKKYQDKKFSFTDVVSFYLMELMDIQKAYTFDKHFSQAGFSPLPQP